MFSQKFSVKIEKKEKSPENSEDFSSVPAGEVLTNELLEDLEKIWALRDIIHDPTNPLCIIKTEGIE